MNKFYKGRKFLKDKFIRHVNRRNPNVKVKLVAERSDGKRIELPVSKYAVFELSDFGYYDGGNFERVRDGLSQFWRDVEFIEHDIIGEGKCYGYNKKTGKSNKLNKHYLYRKPRWK